MEHYRIDDYDVDIKGKNLPTELVKFIRENYKDKCKPIIRSRVQSRFYNNYISIILTLVSMIEALALTKLADLLPNILQLNGSSRIFFLSQFAMCFAILLRVFQTYILAALDYDDLEADFFDLFVPFLLGFIQYYLYIELEKSIKNPLELNFNNTTFYILTILFCCVATIGYFHILMRIKPEIVTGGMYYFREIGLQTVNTILAFSCFTGSVISLLIEENYLNRFVKNKNLVITSIMFVMATIILINIYYSIKHTFKNITDNKLGKYPGKYINLANNRSLETRPADASHVLEITDLIMNNFTYVFTTIFSTSKPIAMAIFKKMNKYFSGILGLGYRQFKIVYFENKIIGLYKTSIKTDPPFLSSILAFICVFFLCSVYLGMHGLARFFRNVKYLRDMSHQPNENEIVIDYIAIKEEYQRKGLGMAIIDEIAHEAKNLDKKTIIVEVREKNKNAIKFYKKCGFNEISELRRDIDVKLGMGHRIEMQMTI